MTLGELYDAVSYLGFETELGEEVQRRGFYAVLGRALQSVNRLCPRVRRVALSHLAPRALMPTAEPRRVPDGESLTLSLPEGGGLLSLSLFGEGSVSVKGRFGEQGQVFSSLGETVVCLPLSGERELTVTALRDVTVGAIGVFGAISPLGELLPRRGVAYDLSRICPDFAAFSCPALYLDGRAYLGRYELSGSRLTLPEDAPSGLYEIECRLAMPRFSPSDGRDRELPLAPELAALLPELVASLIWLDDAPEKAAYYASLYERGYARLRAELRDGRAASVDCPNGW